MTSLICRFSAADYAETSNLSRDRSAQAGEQAARRKSVSVSAKVRASIRKGIIAGIRFFGRTVPSAETFVTSAFGMDLQSVATGDLRLSSRFFGAETGDVGNESMVGPLLVRGPVVMCVRTVSSRPESPEWRCFCRDSNGRPRTQFAAGARLKTWPAACCRRERARGADRRKTVRPGTGTSAQAHVRDDSRF